MRTPAKTSWHPLRWMLLALCLIISLIFLAAPAKQTRTQAQSRGVKAKGSQQDADALLKKQNAEPVGDELFVMPSAKIGKGVQLPARTQAAPEQGIVEAINEAEPNNTVATAQALTGTNIKVTGTIQPGTDMDVYAFYGKANDRVYAAAQTALSSGGSGLTGDGTLELFGTDGTTILEADNDDGSFAATAPSIAGTVLPTTGVYYIRMRHSSAAPASEIDPYDLYLRVQTGTPTAEVEPNDNGQAPNPLPPNGWVSGTINPAGPPIDNDTYSIALNAGDTVFISLDADPERDNTTFNPRLGFGLFDNFFLLADGSAAVTPNSEAFFMSVRDAGTYIIYVDTAVAGAGPTATYQMSVSVQPAVRRACTTYTSTNVPQTIPLNAGLATSTLTVPDSKRIGNLKVNLNITHSALGELDVSLVAPDGNEVVLFDDPPAAAAGTTAPQIDVTLDDEAGLPMALFGINKPILWQPESLARLSWFKNQQASGTWTLNIRDDANVGSGTLNSWGITVCEDPPISCASEATIYSSDFETSDGGFTHSGTGDEWERGLPTFAPITTCNSGTNCWKTDLDNTYNNAPTGQRLDQELVSPNIDLSSMAAAGKRAKLSWAMKYNLEGSNWDNSFVEVREVGNPTNVLRVWEWAGPTMTRTVGSPAVTLNSAAGWGLWEADISRFSGKVIQVVFHLDEDDSVALTGLAIDDVKVSTCGSTATVSAGNVLINEFRLRGTGGTADEFVELYNNTNTDIVVISTDTGSTGWAVVAGDSATPRFTIPNGTVIKARGYYLGSNIAYSLTNYPAGLSTTATPDQGAVWTTEVGDNNGIALFNTTNSANFNAANRLDSAGPSTEANALYREGAGLPPITTAGEYSWVRKIDLATSAAIDTGNNLADFELVATDAGTYNGRKAVLGAPSPDNSSSPVSKTNTQIPSANIEPTVARSASPNRVRVGSGNSGTLSIRRRFVNNTGGTITRLRFRVVDITTLNSPGYVSGGSQADLRLMTSADASVPMTTTGITLVQGTTLETPPAQALGGGLNSTFTTALPGAGLSNNGTVDVQFLFNVAQSGSFRFFVDIEALP